MMADKLNALRDYALANAKVLAIGALCGMLVGCMFQMADLRLTLNVERRWFFTPLAICIVTLGRLGIITDAHKAGEWLARHAMRVTAGDGKRIELFRDA